MSPLRRFHLVALLVGGSALLASAGCAGNAKTDVTGTIKVRGQAPKFSGLQVVFLHAKGSQVVAPVNKDGTFKAEGVPPGDVKVCFAYISPAVLQQGAEAQASGAHTPRPLPNDVSAKSKAPAVASGSNANPVPERLRDTSTSNLAIKIESGKPNVFDFDIVP